jgi:hypothetical protein
LIGTEFFVSTSANGFTAIETFLFHSTKVLIKIQKNVFKSHYNGKQTKRYTRFIRLIKKAESVSLNNIL